MFVKFQDSYDQGTRVGFLLPIGEKVYYTFPDGATVKVCSNHQDWNRVRSGQPGHVLSGFKIYMGLSRAMCCVLDLDNVEPCFLLLWAMPTYWNSILVSSNNFRYTLLFLCMLECATQEPQALFNCYYRLAANIMWRHSVSSWCTFNFGSADVIRFQCWFLLFIIPYDRKYWWKKNDGEFLVLSIFNLSNF